MSVMAENKAARGIPDIYSSYLFAAWTVLILVSVLWNFYQTRQDTKAKALLEAETILETNLAYRRWNTMHGGVYAPVSEKNKPNPYVIAPNRDVTTTTGLRLTLINPFQMTRQAYDLLKEQMPLTVINRTISLRPLNPASEPDAWERDKLLEFERGAVEAHEIIAVNGEPYMRVLKPYITVEGCLKCHGVQGYKVGDIRGAMSISVPMKPYLDSDKKTFGTIILTHLLIWFAGVAGILTLSRKVRKKQESLVESEWKFRTLSDFTQDWEYWIKDNLEIIYMSPSAERITGYTAQEFIDNPKLLDEVAHPEDDLSCRKHTQDLRSACYEKEFRIFNKDGEMRWLSHICEPIYIEGRFFGRRVSNRDITDRKVMEGQLIQSQKMESLGLLAGGIAHDFRNLLTVMSGTAEMLLDELGGEDHRARQYGEQIVAVCGKAQELLNSLLAFSRKQPLSLKPVNINEVVKNALPLLEPLAHENIKVGAELQTFGELIYADPLQLEHVIINLAHNARDAMPQGGTLTFRTALASLEPGYAEQHEVRQGKYAVLAVSDSGQGIESKDLPHVFEPFYTTKESGRGTGLGLSMSYGIIRQHGGFITVDSLKGRGTTFKIYLPVHEQRKT